MNKSALAAIAASASLILSACGSSDDASEDATADTVEMPADEAMAGTPEPVAADLDAGSAAAEDAADASADAAQSVEEAGAAAEEAAADAAAAAEAAVEAEQGVE